MTSNAYRVYAEIRDLELESGLVNFWICELSRPIQTVNYTIRRGIQELADLGIVSGGFDDKNLWTLTIVPSAVVEKIIAKKLSELSGS
jgi:hypothetical protein